MLVNPSVVLGFPDRTMHVPTPVSPLLLLVVVVATVRPSLTPAKSEPGSTPDQSCLRRILWLSRRRFKVRVSCMPTAVPWQEPTIPFHSSLWSLRGFCFFFVLRVATIRRRRRRHPSWSIVVCRLLRFRSLQCSSDSDSDSVNHSLTHSADFHSIPISFSCPRNSTLPH